MPEYLVEEYTSDKQCIIRTIGAVYETFNENE
jgi:hypothetical protein